MEASYQPFFQQYKAPSLAILVWMCRTGDENPNEFNSTSKDPGDHDWRQCVVAGNDFLLTDYFYNLLLVINKSNNMKIF